MGSQACYDAQHEAPAAIVIYTPRGWQIAMPFSAQQVDRFSGGRGPAVVTYRLAPGRPYRSELEALTDATLILERERDKGRAGK